MNTFDTLKPTIALNTIETLVAAEATTTPKPRKPRVWTAFATLFVATVFGQVAIVCGYVAVGIGTGVTMGAQGADSASIQARVQELVQQPLPALLLSLVPFQLGMTCVLLFAAWRSREPLKERLGLVAQSGRTYSRFKLATMACFTIAAAFTANMASSLFLGPPPANDSIQAAIVDGNWLTITMLSVLLSVIPALVEESLFRGYIQRRFLKRWSPAVAITASTLLFAIMHMDSLQHIIAVIPLGCVTGLLAYRTNSVKAGMLVHGLHNVAAVGAGALIAAVGSHYSEETLGMALIGTVAVLGLIGLPAVISLLRRTKSQPAVEASIVPEPIVESLSVLKRELGLPEHATDSRLASQAL